MNLRAMLIGAVIILAGWLISAQQYEHLSDPNNDVAGPIFGFGIILAVIGGVAVIMGFRDCR